MATYECKQSDTEPLVLELTDRNGPADLTGAGGIEFRMEARSSDLLVTVAATAADDPTTGYITVPWGAHDLDVPGLYDAEVTVTKANGKEQTFPSGGDPAYLTVDVKPRVAADA